MKIFSKIFGDPNEKQLKKIQPLVEKINKLEKKISKLSDTELKAKTAEFKKQIQEKKSLDDILPEAFACVREAGKRTLGQRHYDVQLIAGIVLHRGQIAELRTGEGKTLAATLAVYLNALAGKGVHVVTVNDYLARRDLVWMGQIYDFLDLKVACLNHQASYLYDSSVKKGEELDKERDKTGGFQVVQDFLRPIERQEAYQADIVYGTNNEFGFDYLRDNMVSDVKMYVQREQHYAVIDEVDSILIDEARTPLIISAPAEEATSMYQQFAQIVTKLSEDKDYNLDEKMNSATLTEDGITKVEKILGLGNIYEEKGIKIVHHLEQALKAQVLFQKDRDYVVKQGEIIIVDEFTGRLMPGRRYSEGLHQAIEAKENVSIKQESRTLATITLQNLFRMYKKLSGMTGTAVTEAEEFSKIYNLETIIVPTNKPAIRKDLVDQIYKTEAGKYRAIAKEIKARNKNGQPVLVGTVSIEKNEKLGNLLEREGVKHEILNAKNHAREAEIIAQAGKAGSVTIATNMAGRGVDIVLGGNPSDNVKANKIKEAGGLHVIGTERHESRRIDNQLRGRTGRQGDDGSTQFYLSLEDDLMRVFGSDRLKSVMNTLGLDDDQAIENKIVSKSIESAQRKVEGHNFDIRKHLVEYDDVLNKQRETIYGKRRKILQHDPAVQAAQKSTIVLKEIILEMVENEIRSIVKFHTSHDENPDKWNLDEIYEVTDTIFPVSIQVRIKLEDIKDKIVDKDMPDKTARDWLTQYLIKLSKKAYQDLEEKVNDKSLMFRIEKEILLRSIDTLWMEHLTELDYSRRGIGLRGYGQKDPLVEYKKEGFLMFQRLQENIRKQVVYSIYKVGLAKDMASRQNPDMIMSGPDKNASPSFANVNSTGSPIAREANFSRALKQVNEKIRDAQGKKIGRNDNCPCGSGKKYKKCCGK